MIAASSASCLFRPASCSDVIGFFMGSGHPNDAGRTSFPGSRAAPVRFPSTRGGDVPPRFERLCMNATIHPQYFRTLVRCSNCGAEHDLRSTRERPERRRLLGLPPLLHGQRVPRVAGRADRPLRGAQAPGTGLAQARRRSAHPSSGDGGMRVVPCTSGMRIADLVDEAPRPVLAGLERADDRVLGRARVRRGVAVGRVVAAADVAALEADAQVQPEAADGEAVHAARRPPRAAA